MASPGCHRDHHRVQLPDGRLGLELDARVDLRGRVCPVLKTRELLGLSPVDVRHTDHLLVLRDDELLYALHVDHAVDLARLTIESTPPGHAHDSSAAGRFGLVAIAEDRFAQVIEPSGLLGDEERAGLLTIVSSQAASEISM